jgi:protein-S-isoprenylcysteine O-methyltransferase Ste14
MSLREISMPVSAYVQSAIFLGLAAVALFGAAGTLAIVGFWVYLAILVAVTGVSLAILDPDLLRERMHPGGERTPRALKLVGFIPLAMLIVAGLDRGRLHWTDNVPSWLQAAGLIATAAGFGLFTWAMAINRFFSSVARIQTDRGHHVITTGPYAFVRHPGYCGAIILILGSGVALGSWLAAALMILLSIPLLLRRAIREDRLLLAELAGYPEYAQRVRWRLLPGIW